MHLHTHLKLNLHLTYSVFIRKIFLKNWNTLYAQCLCHKH